MTDLVSTPRDILMEPRVTPEAFLQSHSRFAQFISKALEKGTDYGTIPGTSKPTLFKAGAERIIKACSAATRYDIVQQEVDHDREVRYRSRYKGEEVSIGLYRYVVACSICDSQGVVRGQGLGSCSTLEAKYVSRPRDLENTVLKMAQKRALVAATLNTFGLSDRFTQDLEDEHEHVETPKKESVAHAAKDDRKLGYDPNNPVHVNALVHALELKKVPPEKHLDIAARIEGRSISDLDNILKEISQ